MRDRRRLGAPVNMWHTLVSCVELCVFRRWLSEEKTELVWEMGPVRKAQSKACCLMKQTLNPYKLSVHCFFNVTYSLLKKGERRNILLTHFLIVVAVTVKHFAFCLRLPENNFYLKIHVQIWHPWNWHISHTKSCKKLGTTLVLPQRVRG